MSQTVAGPQGGIHPKTAVAGAAVAKGQLLKRGADQNTLIPNTAATIETIGVAADDQDTAGRTFPYHSNPGETVLVRSGAAFALDARLTSDASGRAITAASTNKSTLVAREAATAADQLVVAEILGANSVAP
jgi:hypothetical protein